MKPKRDTDVGDALIQCLDEKTDLMNQITPLKLDIEALDKENSILRENSEKWEQWSKGHYRMTTRKRLGQLLRNEKKLKAIYKEYKETKADAFEYYFMQVLHEMYEAEP